jgi:hypothetical protein
MWGERLEAEVGSVDCDPAAMTTDKTWTMGKGCVSQLQMAKEWQGSMKQWWVKAVAQAAEAAVTSQMIAKIGSG